jgi:hypothetical protein
MGLAAAVSYGAWALWANHAHGWAPAWRAAGTQGFASFTVTAFITAVMEGVHRKMRSRWGQFCGAAGSAILVSVSYTAALHFLMGTPEIWRTIAPVLTLGSCYCVAYSGNLVRESVAASRRWEKPTHAD